MSKYLLSVILVISITQFTLNGQSDKINISIQQKSLSDLLEIIGDLYGVQFSYQSNLLGDSSFSFISADNSLAEFLQYLSEEKDVEYLLSENATKVLLRQKLQSSLQAYKTIQLKLLDEKTKEPIELAAVGLTNNSTGDYTNKYGIVNLPLFEEGMNVEINRLGYQQITKSVHSTDKYPIVIYLSPVNYDIEEVLVKDRLKNFQYLSEYSAYIIKNNSINSSGTLSGVTRNPKQIAGVANFEDNNAKLKIRGTPSDATTIELDHIKIYNATHYFNLFSSINPFYIETSTLYKNNQPIDYGGRTGGLLSLQSTDIYTIHAITGQLNLNNLTANGLMIIPINNNFGISFAGRTSYDNISKTNLIDLFTPDIVASSTVNNFNLLSRNQIINRIPDFNFYDINSSLQYKNGKHAIELNYYQSSDNFNDTYTNKFSSRDQQRITINEENYSNIENWKNNGASLLYELQINDHLNLKNIVSYTSYENNNSLSTSLTRNTRMGTTNFSYSNIRNNIIQDISAQSSLNIALQSNDKVLIGLETVHHDVELGISDKNQNIISTNKLNNEFTLFTEYSKETSHFSYNFGLRGTVYGDNLKAYVSPRASASYQLNTHGLFKASIGRQYQFVRELNFENTLGRSTDIWLLADEFRKVPVRRMDKLMLGSRWIAGRFSIDIEAYLGMTEGHIDLALNNLSFSKNDLAPLAAGINNEYQYFLGSSNTRGIDIMIDYNSKLYTGSIAYTLSKTTDSFDRILKGAAFPSQDDRRHQFKSFHQFYLSAFQINFQFSYASGRTYTDLNKIRRIDTRDKLTPAERLSRLPYYMRMDIGAKYNFKIQKTDAYVGVDLYNLFDRNNVNYLQYIFSVTSNTTQNQASPISTIIGNQTNLVPRTLSLSIGLTF